MPPRENTHPAHSKSAGDDVGRTRMSFGEHLEELRRRVIWSLLGLLASTIFCFNFGDHIIGLLTAPYSVAMEKLGFDPRMVQLNPIESFMEYFKISIKFGIVLAAPWILYQMWKFVAAGLYKTEQRVVKRFAPASIFLFVTGASFMLVVVLSGLMTFLISISMWFPLPDDNNILYHYLKQFDAQPSLAVSQPSIPPTRIPVLTSNPPQPDDGQIWFNLQTQRLNVHQGEETYFLRLQKLSIKQFVQPFFSISEYLGFVTNLALAFGLGFQIPIVVIFLIALHLITAAQMTASRKYVILGIAILAAILTPSPDASTMLLLAVPMVLLFEIGLFLGRLAERREAASSPSSEDS